MCRDHIFQVKRKEKEKTKKFPPKTKHWPPTQLTSINNKHIFVLCTLWGGKNVTNLKQNSKYAPYFFAPSLVVVLVITWSSPIYSPGKLWLGRGWSISIHPFILTTNDWEGLDPSIHPSRQQMIGEWLLLHGSLKFAIWIHSQSTTCLFACQSLFIFVTM
jgi:hypothetical protein